MIYNRGDLVLVPFPFVTKEGMVQKARPALVISDHSISRRFDDVILVAITSQRVEDIMETEYRIQEGTEEFRKAGLVKTSVVRCEYVMTLPAQMVARKLGSLDEGTLKEIDKRLKLSLGLKGQ